MILSQLSNYIKKHEPLLITVLVIGSIAAGYSHVINWLDYRAESKAAIALAASNAQHEADLKLIDQLNGEQKNYKALIASLAESNKKVEAHQAQVVTTTEKQQKVDETLPPDQLATRWDGLVSTAGVAPTADGYSVTQDAALKTVESLEMVPEYQTLLHDEKQISSNDEEQLAGLTKLSATQDELLAGLRAEIVKDGTACKAEVSAAKAVARKSKLKWFFGGVVLGALARNLAGL